MPCFTPMLAHKSAERGPSGKYGVTFSGKKALREQGLIKLPCGKCIGCRLERTDSWGMRGTHEAKMMRLEDRGSCFLTLTFRDEDVPEDGSLNRDHLQRFFKRLRFAVAPLKVRYFACGEYGSLNKRLHYHVILFGFDFPDRKFYRTTKSGHRAYVSALLSELWPHGLHEIGEVTFQSARYVASYVTDRKGGARKRNRVAVTVPHPLTRFAVEVEPEFQLQSLKPGIGEAWFRRFKSDCYPSDQIVIENRIRPMPRYYLDLLSDDEREVIRRKRRAFAKLSPEEQSKARLATREEVRELRMSQFIREGQ